MDTALAQVLSRILARRKVEILPSHLAYGRVSAREVPAPADVPQTPVSHWDGYAVVSADLDGATDTAPVSLKVTGAAGPGARQGLAVGHGEAVQVSTGAPMPSGADSVVPVESVRKNHGRVVVGGPSPVGAHVYKKGEDVQKGEKILRRGQTIRAQDVGLLVSLGIRRVVVWTRPRVSVLATGSELAETGRPKPGKVVNSHSPVFLTLLRELGCEAVDLGTAKDDAKEISKEIRKGLAASDFVLTLGGTSAGKYDFVAGAVASLGPDLLVHGIKMDRGRVSGISVVRGRPILMMPGPIQGAMNAFLLLGLPIISVLSGTGGNVAEIPCTFSEGWEARRRYADFRKIVYVKLGGGPEPLARPLGAETESMKLLAQADGYVVIPENVTRIDPGGRALVRLLPGFSFA